MTRAKKNPTTKGPPPPEEMLGLPERLKRAMKGRKPRVTQEALALKSGVSQSSISNLTSGVSLDGVTAAVVARLAVALDLSAAWLLLGDGEAIPSRQPGIGEPPIVVREGVDQLGAVPAKRTPEPSAPTVRGKAKRLR